MTKPTRRKKRNKLTIILLAPILAFVFIVGWGLSWIGQPKAKQPQKPISKTQTTQNSIELIVIPMQEEKILAN
jgi:flagellar basal body-associated protein FliL